MWKIARIYIDLERAEKKCNYFFHMYHKMKEDYFKDKLLTELTWYTGRRRHLLRRLLALQLKEFRND